MRADKRTARQELRRNGGDQSGKSEGSCRLRQRGAARGAPAGLETHRAAAQREAVGPLPAAAPAGAEQLRGVVEPGKPRRSTAGCTLVQLDSGSPVETRRSVRHACGVGSEVGGEAEAAMLHHGCAQTHPNARSPSVGWPIPMAAVSAPHPAHLGLSTWLWRIRKIPSGRASGGHAGEEDLTAVRPQLCYVGVFASHTHWKNSCLNQLRSSFKRASCCEMPSSAARAAAFSPSCGTGCRTGLSE